MSWYGLLASTHTTEGAPSLRAFRKGGRQTATSQIRWKVSTRPECIFDSHAIYSCEMEPAEKLIRRLLTLVFMILAFVIAMVFEEYYRGMGWLGVLIFIIGAAMGALGIHLWKNLRN